MVKSYFYTNFMAGQEKGQKGNLIEQTTIEDNDTIMSCSVYIC